MSVFRSNAGLSRCVQIEKSERIEKKEPEKEKRAAACRSAEISDGIEKQDDQLGRAGTAVAL